MGPEKRTNLNRLDSLIGLGDLETTVTDGVSLGQVQDRIQRRLNRMYVWLGLGLSGFETVLNFVEERYLLAWMVLGLTVVIASLVPLLGKDPRLVGTIGTAALFALLIGGFFYLLESGFPHYIFWAYVFIPVAFALQGLRRASLWILALFGASIILYLATLGSQKVDFHPVLIRELALSYVAVFVLSFMFEFVREYYERLLARVNQRLEQLATTDQLTRAYNRRMMETLLDHELERATTQTQGFSLILFDLDHFKAINDTHGHQVGDEVLRQVAAIVRTHVRPSDYFGRWGGEEFLVLSAGTDEATASEIAERVREAIADHDFGGVAPVTASFGVATLHDDDTIDTLIRRADAAMYRAKDSGRNEVVVDGDG